MELHSEVEIIENELSNPEEEEKSSNPELESSEKLNQFKAKMCDDVIKNETILPNEVMTADTDIKTVDIAVHDMVSDSVKHTEIRLTENKSDIDSQQIIAINLKLEADDIVVKENISDNNPAADVTWPKNKSDRESERITTGNIKFEADDFVIQENISVNKTAAEPENKLGVESQQFISGNLKLEANDIIVQENVNDKNPTAEIILPENEYDGGGQHITAENMKLEAADVTSSFDDQPEFDDEILFEEEIQFTDHLYVENDLGNVMQGCLGLKEEICKETVTDGISSHPSGTESKSTTYDLRVVTSANEESDFYSDELLRRKGYNLTSFNATRLLTNLSLYSNTIEFKKCVVFCFNLPDQITNNYLVPLFEQAGKVFTLRSIMKNEGRVISHSYVTYTTKDDAEKAVQILNHRKVQGRFLRVEKLETDARIIVKNIAYEATKRQLFSKFSKLTDRLENVIVLESPNQAGKNRGYCFLDYFDYQSARDALKVIIKSTLFGRQLRAEWVQQRIVVADAASLHITNLRLNLRSSDLRKLFSVYGEVLEIDKSDNVADVLFLNAADAQRAVREINKKLLGNENVIISQKMKFLGPTMSRRPRKQINK